MLVSLAVVIIIIIVSVVSKAGVTPTSTKESTTLNPDVQEKFCTLLQAGSDLYSKIPYEDFFDDSLDDLMALPNPTEEQQAQIIAYIDEGVEKMKVSSEDYKIALNSVLNLGVKMNLDEMKAYKANCQIDTVEPQSASAGSSIAWGMSDKACKRWHDHLVWLDDHYLSYANPAPWIASATAFLIFCS